MGELTNVFWNEFEDFQSRTGIYNDREYIFINHANLTSGHLYLWHKKEALHYTKSFGKFTCRVCSKILGIGSTEWSWGDVKSLKNDKHSHLSGKRVKKQTTIYGASCIEMAKFEREQKETGDATSMPLKYWRDDVFHTTAEDNECEDKDKKPKSIFKAYIEDGEEKAIKKRDIINQTKLLEKYGGLTWLDPDNGNMLLYSNKDSNAILHHAVDIHNILL
jgi:hypothetical protein